MTNNFDADVPQEFLILSESLSNNRPLSKKNFIEMCQLAIRLIDSGVSQMARDNIAYHITGFWFAESNINSDSLLSDIGGQFGEWEIPGYLNFDSPIVRDEWNQLKQWVEEAADKYNS